MVKLSRETKTSAPVSSKILFAIVIAAGIAALAMIVWLLNEKEQKTPAAESAPISTSSAYPVCPGPETYRFPDGVEQINVIARADCWSGWIVTPAESSYRIDHDNGAIAYLFVNGYFARLGKNEVSYFGVLRGIFRVKSEEPFSQKITVTVTR